MIFGPELVAKILAGQKTQTRRLELSKVREEPPRCRYVVGKDYAIQPGRGAPAVGRIRVLETRLQRLFDMARSEAIAEGFADVYSFQRYWLELHGSIDLDDDVWVITFELVRVEPGIAVPCSDVNPLATEERPPSSRTRRFGSRTPR